MSEINWSRRANRRERKVDEPSRARQADLCSFFRHHFVFPVMNFRTA
jgi:hypothetical protein